MDTDEDDKQKTISNNSIDSMHVLQSSRIRCLIQSYNAIDGFLLDYGYRFLPYIAIISWIIFLLI